MLLPVHPTTDLVAPPPEDESADRTTGTTPQPSASP
jgi:hypothetical protein